MTKTLTQENYYSSTGHMSVSRYKNYLNCEASAYALDQGLYEPEKTTALLVGSYVDAYFTEDLDKFKEENPRIFTNKGELRADYKQADEIIARIESSPLMMEYLSGEKQVIREAELYGVPWKIKIDSLCNDKLVDLKVMRSLERVMGKSFIEYWGYDIQLAVYQQVEWLSRKKEGQPLPVYIVAATKEKPSDIEIIHIPQWRLDECLDEVKKNLPRVMAIRRGEIPPQRCGRCSYCRQTKEVKGPIDFEDVGFSEAEIKMMKGDI